MFENTYLLHMLLTTNNTNARFVIKGRISVWQSSVHFSSISNVFFSFLNSFVTKRKLDHHVKCVHERYYQAVCHVCAKVYNSAHSLAQHLLEHSDVKRPRIICQVCGKSFKDARIMRKHVERTHESHQLQCPHCPKISPNRNALSRHIQSVHIYTVHKCHLCVKEFKRAVALTVCMTLAWRSMTRPNIPSNTLKLIFRFFRVGTRGHAHRRISIQLRLLPENVQVELKYVHTLQTIPPSSMGCRQDVPILRKIVFFYVLQYE